MRKNVVRSVLPYVAAASLGFGGVAVALSPDHGQGAVRATLGSFGATGCNIKGNVSFNSGERIYHVPGQHYYAETRIDGRYGERYFCSEGEARSAGWRKAGY